MTEVKKKIKRSRNGCHNCKRLKIKCDELKPSCSYCLKTLNKCDYSLKLTWGGRPYKDTTKRKQQSTTTTNIPDINTNAVQFVVHTFGEPSDIQSPMSTSSIIPFEESKRRKLDSTPPEQTSYPILSNELTQTNLNSPDIPKSMATFFNAIDRFVEEGVYIPQNIHEDTNLDILPTKDIIKQDNFLSNYEEDIARTELYIPELPGAIDYQPIRSIFKSNKIENSPDISDILYSIPPQIAPLPTLLLEVPFYRDLLHFWVNVASNHLVPAPVNLYQDNPFKIVLTQMAMEYPSILTTLLAFSAKLRSILIGSNDTPDYIIDQLLTRSCTEMLKILRDRTKAISNVALATSLMLCCFEAFNCKDFNKHRAHIIGARQIIKARSALPLARGPDSGTERDITFFLMRWFVYIDIIGSLSSARNSDNYVLVNDDVKSYEPVVSVTSLNEIELNNDPKRTIDHLMGFDVKFLPYLAKITLLIRKTDKYLQNNQGGDIALETVQQALEVKESMIEILHQDEQSISQTHERMSKYKIQQKTNSSNNTSPPEIVSLINENAILRYTNKIFCDTGIIHLYRRVLKIPRSSSLVQQLANGIGNIAKEHIESKSPTDICCIFCFFTAGCETLDLEMRLFFEQRFERLVEMGNTTAKRGLEIMRRCWEMDEDWISAARELDLDITLL